MRYFSNRQLYLIFMRPPPSSPCAGCVSGAVPVAPATGYPHNPAFFCEPEPHGRRFLILAHQDEIVHRPEYRQVGLDDGIPLKSAT